jgi:hypothetical protein
MTSSDRWRRPEETVQELLDLLTNGAFHQEAEEAVELAAAAFLSEQHGVAPANELIGCAARFTQLAMQEAGNCRALNDFEARQRAIDFLDRHYVSGSASGHPAAILAARDLGEDALPDIIEALKIGLKTQLQSQHVRAIYARLVGSRPWEERCAIAEACRARLREFLPDDLLGLPVHRLEPVLFEMMAAYVDCVGTVSKAVSA